MSGLRRKNNLTIVNQYIDRAFSARTDDRPAFRQMIRESEKKAFSIVLVWKLDRFSRDRYDSAYYKHQLKKHGVRVVSATENISEGPDHHLVISFFDAQGDSNPFKCKCPVGTCHPAARRRMLLN